MQIGVFYFSGTGNTLKVVTWIKAQLEALGADVRLLNMEDYFLGKGDLEWLEEVCNSDKLLFAYPVQASMAPMAVWQFVQDHKEKWDGKIGGVVVSQFLASGDGGAYLARVLRRCGMQVVSVEHFKMPNNVSDMTLLSPSIGNHPKDQKCYQKTKQRAELYAMDFFKGRYLKVGDHIWGIALGAMQRVPFAKVERKFAKGVMVHHDACSRCGVCVGLCPLQNFSLEDNHVQTKGSCTLCYRCVNSCPERAISIISKKRPKKQFRG